MIGDRLRQARLAAGMTQEQVVERLADLNQKLTKAGWSKYEKGKSIPKAAFLIKAASVLRVKASYFLSESTVSIEWQGFRRKSGFTKVWEERIKAKTMQQVEEWIWLRDSLCIQDKSFFTVKTGRKTVEDAEKGAVALRGKWGLGDGPVESLIRAIEDKGGIVVLAADVGKDFDGLSGMANRITPVLIINQDVSTDRLRFNLAHELGHVVLGLGLSKEEDNLAHRFAAAFLVPGESAFRELGNKRRSISTQELGILKRRYGMSMSAWLRRAMDLEIITVAYYRRRLQEFSMNGWRKREPYPLQLKEESVRLKQMALRAMAERIITLERARELYPEIHMDIERMEEAESSPFMSAVEIMKLPKSERAKILARAAKVAEKEYRPDFDLTDFEAFAEEEIFDEPDNE